MSREQGPREAGMRASANGAGHRQEGVSEYALLTEVTCMSREQGPREAGMRASANGAGHRQEGVSNTGNLLEVTA
jgi:hypothetical protein